MKILLIIYLTTLLGCHVLKEPGLSYSSAIVINQTDPALGAIDEFQYMKDNYSGYQVIGRQIKKENNRYYDIFILRDNFTQWVIYFDITKFHDNILPEN
jgi:hypothetical protein